MELENGMEFVFPRCKKSIEITYCAEVGLLEDSDINWKMKVVSAVGHAEMSGHE